MRIRKNARVSVLTHAYDAGLLTAMPSPHVCELNQSPWDVVVFSADSTPADSLSGHFQAGGEHESFYTPDASWLDDSSVGAADESSAVASVKMSVEASGSDDSSEIIRDDQWGGCGSIAREEEKAPAKSMSEWAEVKAEEKEEEGERLLVCNRADGRGWHCWREAVPNHSLCKHHLAQVKVRAPAIRLPASSRTNNKSKSPQYSNRNQFYYYSGFGPRRGKRRGGGCGMESIRVVHNNNDAAAVRTLTGKQEEEGAEAAGSKDEEMEFVDYDDDDDNEGERKRPRKPVKARSLKSLM